MSKINVKGSGDAVPGFLSLLSPAVPHSCPLLFLSPRISGLGGRGA